MQFEISFQPQRSDAQLKVFKHGSKLIINNQAFNFAGLKKGAELPPEALSPDLFAGPVRHDGHSVFVELILPHGPDADDPHRFPKPVSVSRDGFIIQTPERAAQ